MMSLDNEKIENMDPNMLLSIVNMKLRDFYETIDILCYDMDINKELIDNKLNDIGCKYDLKYNKYNKYY